MRGDVRWWDSLRGNVTETLLALLCASGAGAALVAASSGARSGFVVFVLLAVQGAGYAAAPLNSLAAVNADLTPELSRRRRESLLSWTRVTPGVRRWGFGPVAATGAAAAVVLLLAGPVGAPRLDDLPGNARPQTSKPLKRHADAVEARTPRSPVSATSAAPLSPLSPMLTTAVVSPTPRVRPAATTTSARPTPSARPTRAATTPAAVPTSQPTQATTTRGRPTSLPTKPTPTKGPH